MSHGSDDGGTGGDPRADDSPGLRVPVVRLTGAALLGGAIFGGGMTLLGEHQIAFTVCLGSFFAVSMWGFFYMTLRSRLPLDRRVAPLIGSRRSSSVLLIGMYVVLAMVAVSFALTTNGSQVGWRRWIALAVVVALGVVSVLLRRWRQRAGSDER